MMREQVGRDFHDPAAAQDCMARTKAEIELINWLRAQARDRRTDGAKGGPRWYVAKVRPGDEVRIAIRLLKNRVRAFCPRERVVEKLPRGGGRKRVVRRVMFPGYVLVELAPAEACWAGLLSFYGVERLIPRSDRPAAVDPRAVLALQGIARQRPHRCGPLPSLFVAGETVSVAMFGGEFAGCVVRADDKGRRRVLVDVTEIGRVNVWLDQVKKLR